MSEFKRDVGLDELVDRLSQTVEEKFEPGSRLSDDQRCAWKEGRLAMCGEICDSGDGVTDHYNSGECKKCNDFREIAETLNTKFGGSDKALEALLAHLDSLDE